MTAPTAPGIRDANRLLSLVPVANGPQTRKDFSSDQEVRWCPGCGDYSILSTVQGFLPSLGIAKENLVVVSGIGCSSRFPYYVDSYGMHSIHGRAPAIATGLATSRRDLSVWVVTGDGDGLSIGASHLLHALRRNINIKILLFNNQIYGLTKGQYSPTSETGKVTKSTPMGSLDEPFRPISLVLGAEASFVARSIDSDRQHLTSVLEAAAAHEGSAFIEIYQNCNIFNDGAYDALKDAESRETTVLRMEAGKPLVFGKEGERQGLVRAASGGVEVGAEADALIHDPTLLDPSTAFALSRSMAPRPIGVFRSVSRPVYDELMSDQLDAALARSGKGDLQTLINGKDTWTVT